MLHMNHKSTIPVIKFMWLLKSLTLIISIQFFSFQMKGQTSDAFPYELLEPNNKYVLPESLEEISGLTYYAPNQLACLNDEHGRMYVFDTNKGEIVHRVRFAGTGDFEGIEKVGNEIFAIKSNGNLYRFNEDISGEVVKIETPFKSENNVEGLGYDPISGNLLIALKGNGAIDDKKVKGKTIFGFHIASKTFSEVPLFIIKDEDVERVMGKSKDIKPSGVAVHPISGDIYVVASVGRVLIVFNRDGSPKNLSALKRSLFPQPEGITFSPNGDLYISNEREGEGGTILHFKMKTRN